MASPFIQTAFSGGELSEDMYGRLDLPLYGHGLKLCRNWIPLPQGPLARRNGTQDVCAMPDSTGYRLIEFRTSKGLRFVIGFGDEVLRVYDETGEVYGGGGGAAPGSNLLTNPDFAGGETGWTLAPVASVAAGVATIGTTRSGHVLDPETHTHSPYEYGFGYFSQVVAVADVGAYTFGIKVVTAGKPVEITITSGAGTLFQTQISTPGVYAFPAGNAAAGDYTVKVTGPFYESAFSDDHASISFDDVAFFRSGEGASLPAPWTLDQVASIHHVMETGRDVLWLFHPNVETQQLTRDGSGNWSLIPAPWVSSPAEWTGTNRPGTGELYQGRMYISGVPDQPSQVWFSKSGEPEDFTVGAEPDDASSFKAQTKGAIRWLRGAAPAALIIGADDGEYFAMAQAGVIMPGDVQVEPASAFASSSLQALRVGHRVIYVSIDTRRLRAMQFARDVENWISHEVAFAAAHLLADGLSEVHFTREPIPMLVVLSKAGALRLCVFDEAAQVTAWWRFDTTGVVRSAVVLNGSDGSTVWLALERQNGQRLEKWTISGEDLVQVDAQVHRSIPENLTITGLDHLEGEEVEIVIDGALEARQVVAGCEVVLERTGTEVIIGLPFSAKATGLPKDTRGGKARSPKLSAHIIGSALPLVNGWRPSDRTPASPQDQAEPSASKRAKVRSLGWDEEAKFDVEQDLPFRTKVVSISEVVQVNLT